MNYWFTVAKGDQKKPFQQICIYSKTMQQIFIETWSSLGHGVYGGQGADTIHKIFRLLQRTYCSMQPVTISLQRMLKKQK